MAKLATKIDLSYQLPQGVANASLKVKEWHLVELSVNSNVLTLLQVQTALDRHLIRPISRVFKLMLLTLSLVH